MFLERKTRRRIPKHTQYIKLLPADKAFKRGVEKMYMGKVTESIAKFIFIQRRMPLSTAGMVVIIIAIGTDKMKA